MMETRDNFIHLMAIQFAIAKEDKAYHWLKYARACLRGFLENEGIRYGDTGYSWEVKDAISLAVDDISLWEKTY